MSANATVDLTATGSFGIACTKSDVATLSISTGNNGSHATTGYTRAMNNGSNYLSYELYTSSARTTVWGATAGNQVTYTSAGLASATVYVYGKVLHGQDLPAGNYADSVTVTASF